MQGPDLQKNLKICLKIDSIRTGMLNRIRVGYVRTF